MLIPLVIIGLIIVSVIVGMIYLAIDDINHAKKTRNEKTGKK